MATQTFLDLVNNAIYESKATLDPLTSGNFASPPRTTLYSRFKNWVNMAYHELLMKRKEWHFRKERATVDIWPRIHVTGLDVSFTPAVGDVLVGQSSGVQLTVYGVHTFEDVELDTSNEYTLSVLPVAGYDLRNLILRENFSRTTPTPFANGCYLKGIGQYSFNDLVTNLESIDPNTVTVSKTPSEAASEGLTLFANVSPVTYVPWESWQEAITGTNVSSWLGDAPIYISRTPQGKWELFPQPETKMQLSFDFTTKLPSLSAYSDTPIIIPEQYHDYLMWRAVQEYADFDSQAKLFMRATKHVEEYLYWLNRDQMPDIKLDLGRFNING